MTTCTEQAIRQQLAQMVDPATGTPLEESVRGVTVSDGRAVVDLRLGYPAETAMAAIQSRISNTLEEQLDCGGVLVNLDYRIHAHRVREGLTPLPGVKNIIAVASGKGGVGKSTVTANLALALSREGAAVGVLDADIYGPSQPRMLGAAGPPETTADKKILPKRAHGLQLMSIGFLVDEQQAMIWRGPMVTSAMQQLLHDTLWQDLDYLIIDLPPGTGDIQLTLAQKVPVSGAVIVTTPQEIALLDARRGLQMFRRVEVPVLGVVENMSTHVCSACGHADPIFGSGGGERMAEEFQIPLLGRLPLDQRVQRQTDNGLPSVAAEPEGDIADIFGTIARKVAGRLSRQARSRRAGIPNIVIEDN